MTRLIDPQDSIGASGKHKPGQWVQTERKAHEAWARLIARKPRAAELLHHLVAQMGNQNAVVIPQTVLAKLMGRSVDTVQRAVKDLVAERWVSVVRLGKGKELAYIVNYLVAWGQPRDQLRLSVFSATAAADYDDQDAALLGHGDLRRIPTLDPGEQQLLDRRRRSAAQPAQHPRHGPRRTDYSHGNRRGAGQPDAAPAGPGNVASSGWWSEHGRPAADHVDDGPGRGPAEGRPGGH
ncbi:hypothetical protein [Paracoccus sp. (in: a-proteobacteria)]|uniref:hypothetical protein n=1 Tax=Paracoccus sp. TaxID=267 RepID=UPI002AFDD06E|nr:hypothetical protein [Paracoccus sp. (in: a-proteobacteria)]